MGYFAWSVNKSFCFHPYGKMFCRCQHHDHDMVLLIVIMSYASVALGRSVVSLLIAICFLFMYFLRLYSVRAAIDSVTRCSYTNPFCTLYSKLICSYRNMDVSVICIMLMQQSAGIVIRGMTQRCHWVVPLARVCAHCYTISRKVLPNSAMNRMGIILRGNSIQYATVVEKLLFWLSAGSYFLSNFSRDA